MITLCTMSHQAATFLGSPSEIRKALKELHGGKRLDLAVGFIGADWWELLADHRGELRVICWLSSTNTNPYAVADLMKRPNTEVRQRHSLHSKVYIAPGIGALVGSANLSKAALSESDISGQVEAAILVFRLATVSTIEDWFNGLWHDENQTTQINESALDAARKAWLKARAASPKTHNAAIPRAKIIVPAVPIELSPAVFKYARKVSDRDLDESIGNACSFVQSLIPAKLTKAQCEEIVDHIVSWTGHRSSYNRFLGQPIQSVREGIGLLFENSVDLQDRLQRIHDEGQLAGLRIPSLSLLLYWRDPRRFVPYNFRTVTFLSDFKLKNIGMSASSARCYVTWVRWATRLAQRLDLPTPGHIDRMVESYYEDCYA